MELTDRHGEPLDDDRRAYWDARYADEVDPFGLEPNQYVAAELATMPSGRTLDLGSGQGRNAVWLATKGHEVTAVDLSSVGMERARELAAATGVAFTGVVADLKEWRPERGRFDLVLLSYLQVEPELRRHVHELAIEALAPGGTVFLIAHHQANLEEGVGGPQVPELLFDESDLESDFAALDIVRLERVLRHVEGEERPAIDVLMFATKPAR